MSDNEEDYIGSAEEDEDELSDTADDHPPETEEGSEVERDEEGDEEEEKDGEDEQAEEQEEEEEEEQFPPNPVTLEVMRTALSCLTRIGPGLSHAYVRADLDGREITDIDALKSYIHLRYVNLNNNNIKDITPVSSMMHLVTLSADENLVTSLKTEELPFLQRASFKQNRVKSLEGVTHPMLEHLALSFNLLQSVDFPNPSCLNNLRVLDLRGNKLETTAWEYPPNIEEMYLGANLITSLEGIDRMENLRVLHLRDNQLEKLDGFSGNMIKLQYLNIRSNNIEDCKEFKKLQCIPHLRALVAQDNPVYEQDDYRVQVLAALEISKDLERLDKDDIDPEEREEAEELLKEEQEEAENEEEKEGSDDGEKTSDGIDPENTQLSVSMSATSD